MPFTLEQSTRLANLGEHPWRGPPRPPGELVSCVASSLSTSGSGWLVQALPATQDEGEVYEIAFGTLTVAELAGLKEFDGW